MSAEIADALKSLKVKDGRWWQVIPKSSSPSSPVKVKLMERAPGVQKNLVSLSKMISFGTCIATPEAVIECATAIDARASRIDEVVGEYE